MHFMLVWVKFEPKKTVEEGIVLIETPKSHYWFTGGENKTLFNSNTIY